MEVPQRLVSEIQSYTGAPWWNGDAYASFHGLPQQIRKADEAIGVAVGDLANLMDWLRHEQQFDKADILRRIIGQLARAMHDNDDPALLRHQAKGWK